MGEKNCKIFYKILRSEKASDELMQYRKYVDGLAFDEENIDFLKEIMDDVKKIYGNECEVMLIGSKEVLIQAASALKGFKVLLAATNLSDLKELKEIYGQQGSVLELGVHLTRPVTNLTHLTKYGVNFIVMPPSLIIRGRLISEAKARKVKVVAYTVNDAATFSSLIEVGVNAVITTDPTMKREAKKLK